MSGGFPGHDGFQDTTPEEFAAMSEVRFTAGIVDAIVAEFPRASTIRAQLRARVRKANPDAWPTFYDFYDDMPDDGYLSMLCVEAAIARAPLTLAPGATHRLAQTLTAGP